MAKYKLKKGAQLGALSAEVDKLLPEVFVDAGYVDQLLDPSDPHFLVLGRTGSGKTAIFRHIQEKHKPVSDLNPEELSMQYIHGSSVLQTIRSWDVNLDIFYKYLWRHVCILEIIRLRYGDIDDIPSTVDKVFSFRDLWNRTAATAKKEAAKTKQAATDYLEKFGSGYWVTSDTRIKTIVSEVETKLTSDAGINGKLSLAGKGIGAEAKRSGQHNQTTKVEKEVKERAQKIVSDLLISNLHKVVDMLAEHSFKNDQRAFVLLIDDLDKSWMPDDVLYIELLNSLLLTVRDINKQLSGAKVLVALRENIYHRMFQKTSKQEPQREKWRDYELRIKWSEQDLKEMVQRRVSTVFRGQYTKAPPKTSELLPLPKKKGKGETPERYMLARTLMRPRDYLDFLNTYLELARDENAGWSTLRKAEVRYSNSRLKSVFDEWKDSYFGLPRFNQLLTKLGRKFKAGDIEQEDLEDILVGDGIQCDWLIGLRDGQLNDKSLSQTIAEILRVMYLVGLINLRTSDEDATVSSAEIIPSFQPDVISSYTFSIHKMFWAALRLERDDD